MYMFIGLLFTLKYARYYVILFFYQVLCHTLTLKKSCFKLKQNWKKKRGELGKWYLHNLS